MATMGMATLDTAALEAMLGPHLTAEQATQIFPQGQEAVVFTLLSSAKQLAERATGTTTARDPSAPSGQTPPFIKPTAKGRAQARGAKPGQPGHRRPTPTRIDRREEYTLAVCPKCRGPVRPCRGTRTRVIEDIPQDITPVVTEHTIHRYSCTECLDTVEPVVPDALPGSTSACRRGCSRP
jgi:transposase